MEQQLNQVEVNHDFPVPVEKLFSAWVNDEELKQWWKPGGNTLVNATTNLSEGGEFRYEFKNSDHEPTLIITGTYKEVEKEKKLVYTWKWEVPEGEHLQNNEFLLKVNFTAVNDQSSIRIIQENFQDHEHIHPHEKGWHEALEALEVYLSR